MNAEDTVRAYKDLARVERAFRAMKAVDLQIRPVHHWIEPRVRAHVFLCMLGYYVEWHLREAWAPILFHDHDRAAAQQVRISPVAAAEISDAAKRKRRQVAEIDAERRRGLEQRLMMQGFAVDQRSVDVPGDRNDSHARAPRSKPCMRR